MKTFARRYSEKISGKATSRTGAISASLSIPIFSPSPTMEISLGRPVMMLSWNCSRFASELAWTDL